MENLLDCAPLPDQIRPGNKVLLSAAGGWATPTTGQQQFAYCTNDFDDALAVALAEQGFSPASPSAPVAQAFVRR